MELDIVEFFTFNHYVLSSVEVGKRQEIFIEKTIMKNFVASEFSILIVDNDPENLKLLANLLVKVGYNVSFAKNCKELRQRISHLQPDLILLDCKMPKNHGFEVCHQLQEDLKYQDIPIIFINVSKKLEDFNHAFELGTVDCVQKPFHHEEVLARVKTHLTIKKKSEELQQSAAQLNTIINHLYDGILIIDQHGVVKFANPAAARIFGQPLEALLNYSFRSTFKL